MALDFTYKILKLLRVIECAVSLGARYTQSIPRREAEALISKMNGALGHQGPDNSDYSLWCSKCCCLRSYTASNN